MYDKKRLKEIWALFVKPVYKPFLSLGIRPVHITLCGSLLIMAGCYSLLIGNNPWAFGLFLLGGTCDAIDGAYARATDQVTVLGGFLDSIIDRYNEFILIGCVLYINRDNLLLYYFCFILFLGLSLMSYTRALFEKNHFECLGNPFEYLERGLLCLLFLSIDRLDVWLVVIAIGTHIFVIHRVYYFNTLSKS